MKASIGGSKPRFRIQPRTCARWTWNSTTPIHSADLHPESYERLLLDALAGEASLFTRADEVETAWGLIDPILEYWDAQKTPLSTYEPGSWGPAEADEMITLDGRSWSRWQKH